MENYYFYVFKNNHNGKDSPKNEPQDDQRRSACI